MSESFNADIEKAIQAHLPEQTAGVLRHRLESIAKLENDNGELITRLDHEQGVTKAAFEEISQLKEQVNLNGNLDTRESELDARQAKIEERERGLANTLLNIQIKALESENTSIKEFMINVSRNTVYKRELISTVPVAVSGVPGNDGYGPTPGHVEIHSKSETITETQE